ncbi:unnamed protein product, partial [Prorocentrum cordatum]
MAALEPGPYACARSDEVGPPGELWHERLILAWVSASLYVVLTPDCDVFIEQLDIASADRSGMRFGPAGGGLPAGLAGGRVHRFAVAPALAELAALLAEGLRRRSWSGKRAGIAPAAVPLPLPAPPAPAALGAVARRRRPRAALALVEVALPSAALDFGGRSAAAVAGELRAVTRLEANADIDAWARERQALPQRGEPRLLARARGAEAAPFLADASLLVRDPSGFPASHERWPVESRVGAGPRSAREHGAISKALELAASTDGLDLANLISMGHLNRRRQLLEEAHAKDPEKADFEGARHFMGEGEMSPGALAAPSLRAHS